MIVVKNNCIACEAPKHMGLTGTGAEHGLKLVKEAVALIPLKIVYGNERYQAGDTVYLLGSSAAQVWYKTPTNVHGKDVIFVREEFIMLLETEYPPAATSTSGVGYGG